MNYTIDTISGRVGFDALASEWGELLACSDAASLFLTHEWITAWFETLDALPTLAIVTARDDAGRLCGVAPFYIANMRLFGVGNYRCLRVLGDSHSGAENQDLIIQRASPDVALSLQDGVHALRAHFDWMWLPHTRAKTGGSDRMSALATTFAGFRSVRQFEYCEIDLPDNHDAYLKRLSKAMRYNLRRQHRQFGAAANIEQLMAADQLDAWLDTFFTLHQKRWQSAGQRGSFVRRPLLSEFYRNFAPVALQRGWLRFYRMQLDGTTVAMQLGYKFGDRMLAIQEGFDPSAVAGAGNTLRDSVIRQCIAEGVKTYDFLAHSTSHKMRWRSATTPGFSLFCGLPGARNLPLRVLSLWPNGRFIQN